MEPAGERDATGRGSLTVAGEHCICTIPTLIGELNRHLKGWADYFSIGYSRGAHWEIDWYVRGRLIQHLRRSQRPFRPPAGVSWYQHLQQLGLVRLSGLVHA